MKSKISRSNTTNRRVGRVEGERKPEKEGRTMQARSGKGRGREVKEARSAPRSMVPSSAPRSVALSSAPRSVAPSPRHVGATLVSTLERCRHLGATTCGAELCYLGATIRGAEV